MFTLTLDTQEKAYLEWLLESDLAGTRVEVRRTEPLTLHDERHQRAKLIRGLLEKQRGDEPPATDGPLARESPIAATGPRQADSAGTP